jgi:hypothetical protein
MLDIVCLATDPDPGHVDCDALRQVVVHLQRAHGITVLPPECHVVFANEAADGIIVPAIRLRGGSWVRGLQNILTLLQKRSGVDRLLRFAAP